MTETWRRDGAHFQPAGAPGATMGRRRGWMTAAGVFCKVEFPNCNFRKRSKRPMTTATATKESEAAGVADRNGHLTKADEYRRNVSAELADALVEFDELTSTWEGLKADTADAKKDVDGAQRRVNRLAAELRDIENGCYQPKLLDKPGVNGDGAPAAPVDEGAALPIDTLTEFSMTQAKIDLLKESKFEIATVGDLERTIRENVTWHRDIKGFGETAVDKLMDVLLEFRKTYPVPVPAENEVELVVDGKSVGTMPGAEAVTRVLKDATEKLKA